MDLKETREQETSHLERALTDKQKHLFELRSQAVTEKLEDPSQLGKTRREIAQIKTILRERVLKEPKTPAPASDGEAASG